MSSLTSRFGRTSGRLKLLVLFSPVTAACAASGRLGATPRSQLYKLLDVDFDRDRDRSTLLVRPASSTYTLATLSGLGREKERSRFRG